jgi:hypothetical protein
METLTHGETIAHALPLAAAALVVTSRGEIEARPGDYLVVTDTGRQIVMSRDDYRAVTGTAESSSPGIPEAEASTPPVPKRVPGVLGALMRKRKRPAPAAAPAANEPDAAEPPTIEDTDEVMTESQPPPDPPKNRLAPTPRPRFPLPPDRLENLESQVLPGRPRAIHEWTQTALAKPKPKPKKAVKRSPLPFQKKAKRAEDPKKQRYRYVKPEWI